MSATNTVTSLYNPKLKTRDQLVNEFVVRTKIFENIFHDIEKSKMKHPEQHYLLIGQRGAGKTTLLERLKYAISESKILNNWLIPISLNEEQYNISELANLWETIGEILEDYYNMPGMLDEMQARLDLKNYEEAFFKILVKNLEKHGKKLVLLIDNIGDILAKFDEIEVKRLREILTTSPYIRLIAGSPVVFDGLFDYHQPLMEFFSIIYLKGLDRQEMETLLIRLGQLYNKEDIITKIIKETPERVEVLRRLTGGVPRTIVMLFNIFADNQDGKALKDFIAVIDQATPLYKHNMDDLSVQQQKIVDTVAKAWDGVSVKYIKEKVRMESKNISTQLSLLERNQIITKKKPIDSKNNIYMLQDRFFNIWYLMRHGRRYDKKRVEWLVRFFEAWLDKDELKNRIIIHIQNLDQGTYDPQAAILMFETYKQCNIDFESKYQIYNKTKQVVPDGMHQGINFLESEILNGIEEVFNKGHFETVLEIGQNYMDNPYIMYVLAKAASILKKNNESEKYYLKSIEIFKTSMSMIDLGIFYLENLNNLNNAHLYLMEGIKMGLDERLNLIESIKNRPKGNNSVIENGILARDEFINRGLKKFQRLLNLKDGKSISSEDKQFLLSVGNAGFHFAFEQLGFIAFSLNNLTEALYYFDKAFVKGSESILMLSLYLEILITNNVNLNKANHIMERLKNLNSINIFPPYQILINLFMSKYLLWKNEIESSLDIFSELLIKSKEFDEELITDQINQILIMFIAKQQYNITSNLFENENYGLKDRYKPIYYALQTITEIESEKIKMGNELNETVKEIIQEILVLKERYKNPPVYESETTYNFHF